ncbi:MAG: FAD:protein FMN transferase [Phycisphaerae bacterium]|nr:FAD:protein FMN transferase [Phycisphaerae bacterium]
MSSLSRRRFLCITAGVTGAGALAAGGWLIGRRPPASGLQQASRSGYAFGTTVSMTVLHPRRQTGEAALADAFHEMQTVERVMTLYNGDSQLCRLNRDGELRDPHPMLADVLARAQAMSARSSGAFDVTVGPLWSLFAGAAAAGGEPAPARLDAVRSRVNWQRLEVSPRRVRLADAGMGVTLNGIAQGYAADRVVAALRRRGIEHALVNTGEVGSIGGKGGGSWVAGIPDPRDPSRTMAAAALDGRALATSGDYATHFSADFRDNHIFDPATGRSPTELASVTVVTPDATEADAMSTAVFVLGVQRGLTLVAQTPRSDAMLVLKDGRVITTAGFPETPEQGRETNT